MYPIIFIMDTLIVSHINALRAIRRERRIYSRITWEPLNAADARRTLKASVPNRSYLDLAHYDCLGFLDDSDPTLLHVLVGSPASRRTATAATVITHVFSGNMPAGSIMRVEPGLYAVSPAFAALQYSIDRSYEETFMLLMELLGTYTLPEEATFPLSNGEPWIAEEEAPKPSSERSDDSDTEDNPDSQSKRQPPAVNQIRYQCEPATTIKELQALSAWAKSSRYATFRSVVRHVTGGSASPMESIMYGMFALPMSHGGFACNSLSKDGVQLNKRIDFDSHAREMASGMPYAICDAYIQAAETTLEYNGEYHEAASSVLHDAKRNNGLSGMGISVIIVTREQMCDLPALEAIAISLYRRAGRHFRYRIAGYRVRQQNLLNGLRKGTGLKAV